MLPAERRDLLLSRLSAEGKVIAKDVAFELGIAEDTIRRDLREMAAAGLCQRVYGGALPAAPAAADYATRAAVATDSKKRVAEVAASLIRPGMTVLLDGGTTALAVAGALPADLSATIVTHSVTVAAALVSHPSAEVLVLGGRLFKHSAVTCGAAAVEAAQPSPRHEGDDQMVDEPGRPPRTTASRRVTGRGGISSRGHDECGTDLGADHRR